MGEEILNSVTFHYMKTFLSITEGTEFFMEREYPAWLQGLAKSYQFSLP